MAGGPKALASAVEVNEDSEELGQRDIARRRPTRKDVVIGLSASGRTPYVVSATAYARARGAFAAAVTCNQGTPLSEVADIAIIADGLRATLGVRPFAEIRRLVEDIITVSDESIVRAMRQMWEVLKIVVEPSAAVPYAALLEAPAALRARRIGIIVSGGNLDLDHLPWSEPA